jgi:hypothetical protein
VKGTDGLRTNRSTLLRAGLQWNPISLTAFCIHGFRTILSVNSDFSLNSVNQLIFVMVKCGVFFAVRTELLNII